MYFCWYSSPVYCYVTESYAVLVDFCQSHKGHQRSSSVVTPSQAVLGWSQLLLPKLGAYWNDHPLSIEKPHSSRGRKELNTCLHPHTLKLSVHAGMLFQFSSDNPGNAAYWTFSCRSWAQLVGDGDDIITELA